MQETVTLLKQHASHDRRFIYDYNQVCNRKKIWPGNLDYEADGTPIGWKDSTLVDISTKHALNVDFLSKEFNMETFDGNLETVTIKKETIEISDDERADFPPVFQGVQTRGKGGHAETGRSCGSNEGDYIWVPIIENDCLDTPNPLDSHSEGEDGADEDNDDREQRDYKRATKKTHKKNGYASQMEIFAKKIFICSDCGKTFNRTVDLSRHITVHKKEDKMITDKPSTSEATPTDTERNPAPDDDRISEATAKQDAIPNKPSRISVRSLRSMKENPEPGGGNVNENFESTGESKEKPRLLCHMCNTTFLLDRDLKQHYLTHKIEDVKYSCFDCGRLFSKQTSLILHSKTHKDEKSFNCILCNETFKRKGKLREHMKLHGQEKLLCKDCGKIFADITAFKKHIVLHTEGNPYACNLCDRTFKRPDYLKDHKLIHGTDRSFNCEECGKNFKSRSNLRSHKQSHISDRPYSCELCVSVFKRPQALRIHMQLHQSAAQVVCGKCEKGFADDVILKRHMVIHTDSKVPCLLCDAVFDDDALLKHHMPTHAVPKPHPCEVCENSFSSKVTLRKHMRLHSEVMQYPCHLCDAGFRRKEHWQSHLRRHTGDRPFVCDICGKSFTMDYLLTKHRKIHAAKKFHL